MAAGLGFKTFVSGDVLTAADTNGYLMQGVLVFATVSARDAAITSPQEGQFAFTKDADSLFYYDGSSWVASSLAADITGVTAGTAISGGGTSGTVTVNVDVNAASTVTATSTSSGSATLTVSTTNTSTATAVAGDYVLIEDVSDNTTKKALISDITALVPPSDPIPLILALS